MNNNLLINGFTLVAIIIVATLSLISAIDLIAGFSIVAVLFIMMVVYNEKSKKNKQSNTDANVSEFKDEIDVEKIKVCHVCSTKNNINRKYCRKCNTWIKNITCPICEQVNPHTEKYCLNCDSILQNKKR